MKDQAYHLRNLKLQSAFSERSDACADPVVIAIAGSKGGVGTTSIMMGVGQQLAAERYPVAMTCWNSRFADLCALCDVDAPSSRATNQVLQVPASEGLKLVFADVRCHDDEAATAKLLVERLVDRGVADVVLVDLGGDLDGPRRAFCAEADAVIVATTADNLAVMDAYASVKSLSRHPLFAASIYLLVNQVSDDRGAREASERLRVTCRRFLQVHLPPPTLLPLCDVRENNSCPLGGAPWVEQIAAFSTQLMAHMVSDRQVRSRVPADVDPPRNQEEINSGRITKPHGTDRSTVKEARRRFGTAC